jgi:hypothetical protein
MRADDVAALAERHGIADRDGLRGALATATFLYGPACDEGPDTLDEIEKPAIELTLLLIDDTNQRRIISALLDEYHEREHSDDLRGFSWHRDEAIKEVFDNFEEMLRRLDAVRLAARRAHQKRGRGRPRNQDIRNAYAELADFWKRSFGEERFTQGWAKTDDGLVPTSDAACFLCDAMRLIDPRRPRLAEELRALMPDDVRAILGQRRGRKKNLC